MNRSAPTPARGSAAFLAMLLLGTAAVAAGAEPAPPADEPAAENAAAGQAPGMQDTIGAGDLLRVGIAELTGPQSVTSRDVRVDDKGRVTLPYVGGVKLQSLTTADAEAAVKKAYADAKVTERPTASVRRLELAAAGGAKGGPLAAGDLLKLTFTDLTGPGVETVRHLRVQAAGAIGAPYVGAVKVVGLSEAEAGAAVAEQFSTAGVIARGAVSVLRIERGDKPGVKPGPATPGDLLQVIISGLTDPRTDTVQFTRVGRDGKISLPYAGALDVNGKDEIQCQQAVAGAYEAAGVLQRPIVSVLRVESAENAAANPGAIEGRDLLRIAVFDLIGPGSQTVKVTRVSAAGEVRLPYVGKIKLAGSTDAEAEQAIARAYRDQNVMEQTAVSVLKIESAPADAGDLPDVPTRPIPEVLREYLDPPKAVILERP